MSLVKKNKVDFIRGRGTLKGGKKVVAVEARRRRQAGRRHRPRGHGRDPGHRQPGQEPARARRPTASTIVTSDDVLRSDDAAEEPHRGRRGAVGVEFASFYHDVGVEVTLLEYLPGLVPLEDAELSARSWSARFTRRGIEGHDQRPLRPGLGQRRRAGRLPDGRQGGRGAGRAARRADAGCRPAGGHAYGGRGPGDDARQGGEGRRARSTRTMRTAEPHLYAIGDIIGGLLLAHVAAHEGIAAVNAIAGGGRAGRLPQDAARHVLPAPDRLDRPHPGGLRARRHAVQGRARCPSRPSARRSSAATPKASPRSSPHRETDEVLGVHMIGPHVTDLIAEASAAMLFEATAWEIGEPSTRIRPCRRRSARPRSRSTAGRSTSDARDAAAARQGSRQATRD